MNHGYSYDPLRRALVVGDPRLTKLLQLEPERCASVSEYAHATGIETFRVMELFGPALDHGAIAFEPVGPELMVHTAPGGRPTPSHVPDVAPNLWERLRGHGDKHYAYTLWQLMRGMEQAGWRVEANVHRIMFQLSPLAAPPQLGLVINTRIVPLVIYPSPSDLSSQSGRLAELVAAGAGNVAVICDSGALDEMTTAVRLFYGERGDQLATKVLLLEAPRYNPVLLSGDDHAVAARSVTRDFLEQQP